MKKIKIVKISALLFILLCGYASPGFAQGGDGIARLIAFLTDLYNKTISFVADTIYAVDPYLPNVSTANSGIINTNSGVENATRNTATNLVHYYFTGEEIKVQDAKNLVKQSIDILQSDSAVKSISGYKDVFKTTTTFPQEVPGIAPQYDVGALLMPNQYSSDQLTSVQRFINNLETLSPPPQVINISNDFVVPYSPKTNEFTSHIVIKDSSTLKSLKDSLKSDNNYAKYVGSYNKAIIARTTFMNVIAAAYQDRVSYDGNPSAAQQDYAEATMRLKNDSPNSYYQQMQSAPPSVVERESLFLLAEIHHDLYLIRKQNEAMAVMQAISGLQTSSFTAMFDKSTTTNIAKKIYCFVNTSDSACAQQAPTSSAAPPPPASTSPTSDIMGPLQENAPKS